MFSVWGALGFAILALVWGLAVQSQMIVFDGLYSLISVALSLMSLVAFRIIRKGESKHFPFGRVVLEPLTIIVKATAIGALCVYALTVAVMDIIDGGREVNAGWASLYAGAATLGCAGMAMHLHRRQKAVRSDLLRAETTQWLLDTVLSAGVLIGFLVAMVLQARDYNTAAGYVDPAMVAIVCLLFLAMPVKLLAQGFREVMMMAPAAPIEQRVRDSANGVQQRYAFDDMVLRCTKVGGQLVVEVDYVVGAQTTGRTVEVLDEIRQEMTDDLRDLNYELWLSVSFTSDVRWAE
ncbi:cytochrome c551 [Hoyosella rhizosphaerae]|uniref:Cytochrome c551 n=1 Tax=Hoyosella rhizosphaerae TaxID=1755582 RepID=A0A916XEZ2_9ACTN|nr:cytochrome c551 [Hoyosella rhizosphaerae]